MEYSGIVAGLGNPGAKFERTRHNCGFMFIDALLWLAQKDGAVEELNGKKFNCRLWRISLPQLEGKWLAVEPLTFMNDSGLSIQPLLAWYRIPPTRLLVVHDELDIPPGQLRFKSGGGLAGHNGLSSISRLLGSSDYKRLRIGIGKPSRKGDMIAWVLGRPPANEGRLIDEAIQEALECFFIYSREGVQAAAQYARDASRKLSEGEPVIIPPLDLP